MCDKCDKFQIQIDRYQRFLTQRYDPLTEQRMKAAVVELEERKVDLHQAVPPRP
jgi:hypothetical protein